MMKHEVARSMRQTLWLFPSFLGNLEAVSHSDGRKIETVQPGNTCNKPVHRLCEAFCFPEGEVRKL